MLRRNLAALLMGALALTSIDAQQAKTDQAGDPLPPGASARMGTLRWRHGGIVSYVACTPDGKGVLSVASDNTIRLWDREKGKEIRRFEPKTQNIGGRQIGWANYAGGTSRIAMSPDGKLLAVVLPTNVIQLWNIETGKELREFKAAQGFVNSIRFAPDSKSLAARGSDRNTYLVDTDGNAIRTLKAPQPNVAGGARIFIGGIYGADFAFSHDGKAFAAGEMEVNMNVQKSYLKITDTNNGNDLQRFEVANGMSGLAYSGDGRFLAYASSNIVYLRQADGAKEIRQIDTKTPISGLAFSPDSKNIAVKGRDQVIRVYESDNGSKVSELGEPDAFVGANAAFIGVGTADARDFAFAHDGKALVVGGTQALRFFTVANGKEQAAAAGGHRTSVTAVVLTPDGKTMFSRGADKMIRRWDAATGKELGKFAEPTNAAAAIFAPDGKTAAVVVIPSGDIHLIRTEDGKSLHQLKGHNGVAALAFSADGKMLASRGVNDDAIKLFDVAKGGEFKQIAITNDKPADPNVAFRVNPYGMGSHGLAFSPDGQTIAANNSSGMMRVANPGGGIGMQAANNMIHQWDVLTGKEIRKITLPANRMVVGLAYSPDGRLLAAETSDQTVSLIELASGKERALLGTPVAGGQPLNTGFVVIGGVARANLSNIVAPTVAFTPDGGVLAVRGPNNSLRIWDVAHTKELETFKGHDGTINALAMAADGKSVASASTDTTLLVWDLTRVKREPNAVNVKLEAKEVDALWADLFSDDGQTAARAILKLSASEQTTPFLRGKLKPATPPDVKQIDQWIHDLDSVNFPKRTKASVELEKLGELAIPALRKILDAKPSPETRRRVEPILEKLTTGTLSAEQVRYVRAVETLERLGNSDARQLLQTLADGAPGALATRHAQAALGRMGK